MSVEKDLGEIKSRLAVVENSISFIREDIANLGKKIEKRDEQIFNRLNKVERKANRISLLKWAVGLGISIDCAILGIIAAIIQELI